MCGCGSDAVELEGGSEGKMVDTLDQQPDK